jgi:signal transduction histidine kinase
VTGTGIARPELLHLFERFYRVEGATGRTHEGSGIGLALVQDLARLHGGSVGVESEVGRGSTFTVLLPLRNHYQKAGQMGDLPSFPSTAVQASAFVEEALRWLPDVAASAVTAPDDDCAEAPATEARTGRQRIVLADDNADLRAYIARILADAGYDVCAMADGEAALAAIRDKPMPDLVLTDVMMPRLDGFGLLRAIREDATVRDLPVVMLSARAGEEASIDGLNAGADDYLVKPFSARELLARVRNNLNMVRLRNSVAEDERRFRRQAEAAQEELQSLNDTLEQRVQAEVAERARAEAELLQAQKMDAIGRVAAGVAHDFNNLLQALTGSLEMILAEAVDRPVVVEWGQVALRATQRGKDLTDRLLSYSHKQVLSARPVMIDALFSGLYELVSHLFETKVTAKTTLTIVPCSPGLAVLADVGQLQAAMINLTVNALDAMKRGGCLRISAYAADADPAIVPTGRYTVISVADTGCGMDEGTLARACEPFFTTKGLNGTGLGLSMVQGFAQQSGGEAHITSVPGEGTTIDLWLPSANSWLPAVSPLAALSVQTIGDVLVVDDSEDVLLVVASFLRLAGLQVTSKTSGALALAELESGHHFGLIITDFAMPGMNGLELLTLAHEIDPALVGLIITGFSDPEVLTRLSNVTVLRKPFNRAELVECVLKLIGEHK